MTKYILQMYNYKYNDKLNVNNTVTYFKEFIHYYKNLKSIIKIQTFFRKINILNINKLKGPGVNSKCVNDTDFYTFEEKNKIEYNYFFSIKENDNIYFFDIRSFKLLIDNHTNNTIINPYNRNIISNEYITKFNKLVTYLKNINVNIFFEPDILTEEQIFNQKIIHIFQIIDSHGYNTSIEWFTNLNILQLRKFWINLEDIWNYRCNLDSVMKNNIILKTKKQPFSCFKLIYTSYKNTTMEFKKHLQKVVLNDIHIFITSGITAEFCNTGCLYVLTALASVSKDCMESMPWLLQ